MSTAQDAPPSRRERTAGRSAQDGEAGGPLRAAKEPVGPGGVTYVGMLLALIVLLVGATGLQTAAAAAGLTTSRPWWTRAVEGVQGLRPLSWAVPVAVLLVLVGLWLVVTGLRPRPKTAVALEANTGVFLRPRDLAQLAEDAADDVDGVTAVHATASRGRVSLTVHSTGGPSVAEAVQQAVSQRLSPLKNEVRVAVRTKQVDL